MPFFLTVGTRLFNDPRMTLGSYVKGSNNMICREVGLKGRALVIGQRFRVRLIRLQTNSGNQFPENGAFGCDGKRYFPEIEFRLTEI